MTTDASPESFTLAFIAGPRTGETIELLPGKECILGRGSDADILIDHKRASRRHAKILAHDETLEIEDLDSINGTIVNGEKIGNQELFSGDSIQITDARIRVRRGSPEAAEEAIGNETVGIFSDRDANGEFATMANAMSGDLATTSPRVLLEMMQTVNVTGVLSIHPVWGAGRVLFNQGRIYYARIDGLREISPTKALQRLMTASSGTFEFSDEPPIQVENEIDLSLQALLQDIESFPEQHGRLDKLMPSPDALLVIVDNEPESELSDDEKAIVELARTEPTVSAIMDGFPGTDTQAAKTLADLVERGVLAFQR